MELEVHAILAFVKFGSVKVSALLLPAVLIVTRHGFRGRIVKDLLATFNGPFTAIASRVEFRGNPLRIVGVIICFHRFRCVCVCEAGIEPACEV